MAVSNSSQYALETLINALERAGVEGGQEAADQCGAAAQACASQGQAAEARHAVIARLAAICGSGSLPLARWAIGTYGLGLGASENAAYRLPAFTAACESGSVPLVEWLAHAWNITGWEAREARAFLAACERKRLGVARRLAEMYDVRDTPATRAAGRDAHASLCSVASPEELTWFEERLSVTAKHIRETEGKAFFIACLYDRADVVSHLRRRYAPTPDELDRWGCTTRIMSPGASRALWDEAPRSLIPADYVARGGKP
jgi:hypothetical protein